MTPEEQTRQAWALFGRFSNSDLAELLTLAGVRACADRALALHQALIVWFHGNVPSLNEVARMSERVSAETLVARAMRTHSMVLVGSTAASQAVSYMINRSAWFQIEPLPDDQWELTVKEEVALPLTYKT